MRQATLAMSAEASGFVLHGKTTRRTALLARTEALVPWCGFRALIEPHYPPSDNGRRPVGFERMRRMYLIANWFNLAK